MARRQKPKKGTTARSASGRAPRRSGSARLPRLATTPHPGSDGFQALASHLPVGVFLADVGGDLRFVNQRGRALTGLTAQASLGRGWLTAVHPLDRSRLSRAWDAAVHAGRDLTWEFRFAPSHGNVVWVLMHASALPDANGKTTGFVGTWMDITEQRRALGELATQRAFLRQVIDLEPNFIFAKDRVGRFTLVNQAVADAYGTTVENLIGKTDADFNPNAEEVRHFREDDLEVMDTKQDKLIPEEVITDAAGQVRYLQTIKRAIVDPGGKANQVLGVASDITARKKLEEQLLQSQKMEAVGRLAGGIAHDFNNLLTVVLGSIGLMLEDLEPGHRLRPAAEDIQKAGERAAMLTQQLLAFGRKQVLQPRTLDLSRVVTESAEILRRLIGEDVQLTTVFQPGLGSVKADFGQITQVILNLAINARDAMPHGGTLKIEVANVALDDTQAAMDPEIAAGEYVMLAVSDSGHGIPERVMPRIFEPFFTTKTPGRGTGLGLATSYGIVKQSGGHITATSHPGHGTTLRVYLPRVEERAEPDCVTSAPVPRGRETLLLVEDEDMVREVAGRALRRQGYQVLEARNGNEALRVAAEHPGVIQLVVADLIMPEMGGIELAAQLVRSRPETRVLYTSGYTEESIAFRGELDAGAPFLRKPYLPETLTRRVREVLDGARSHRPGDQVSA